MKFAPCTGRIKQVGHGTADDRADNTEHDRPRDRQMHMHERLGDTTYEEADEEIPNEVKHIFLVTSTIGNSTRSDSKIADRKRCKRNAEGEMPNDEGSPNDK